MGGPYFQPNEAYQTKVADLTTERILKQPFPQMKRKIDRIRINQGNISNAGSTLSASQATTSAMMTTLPFSRTGMGSQLKENLVHHHKLVFDYGSESANAPSDKALASLREKEEQSRVEGHKRLQQSQLVYNGCSTF